RRNIQNDAGTITFLVSVCHKIKNRAAAFDPKSFLHKRLVEESVKVFYGKLPDAAVFSPLERP
ncbi:MAG: hypothetical protein K6A39_00850, partial [Clostridiales bacterium]|nr:hypothetical protein [Clostridiales bacterium]